MILSKYECVARVYLDPEAIVTLGTEICESLSALAFICFSHLMNLVVE